MAFCVINLSEKGRNTLGHIGTAFCALLAALGLVLIAMALHIRTRIQTNLQLLDNYNGNSFIYYLIVVGTIVIIAHSVGLKIFADLGFYESRYRWENHTRLYGLIVFVVQVVVFVTIIVVFTHQYTMKKYFKTGLRSAMDRYSKSPEIKTAMDDLQMQLKCCGSNASSDWFSIAWIENTYLDLRAPEIMKDLKDGVYRADNVPFSCCNANVTRPCIHRNVKSARTDYVWPKDSTLHGRGCVTALVEDFGKTALNVTGYIVVTTYLLMWAILIVLKLLSTGIANTYPWGDPEGDAPTWLLEMCPVQWCDTETPKPPDDTKQGIPGLAIPQHKRSLQAPDEEEEDTDEEDEVVVQQPLLRSFVRPSQPVVPVVKHRLINTEDQELPDIVYSHAGHPLQRGSFDMAAAVAAKRVQKLALSDETATDYYETSVEGGSANTSLTSGRKRKKHRKKKDQDHGQRGKKLESDTAGKNKPTRKHRSNEAEDNDDETGDGNSAGSGDGAGETKKKKDRKKRKDGANKKKGRSNKSNRSKRRKKR